MADSLRYSREWWCDLRSDLVRRYTRSKSAQGATLELSDAYGRIPPDQRSAVNAVLMEWVQADEVDLRFDALAIVRRYKITEAVPALRALQDRLESESRPGAPYEWAKVNRILGSLQASDG